jgi:hypothetical protein
MSRPAVSCEHFVSLAHFDEVSVSMRSSSSSAEGRVERHLDDTVDAA